MKTPDPNKRHDPAEDEVQIAKEVRGCLIACAVAGLALALLGWIISFFVQR
jgi:hypothetical protein